MELLITVATDVRDCQFSRKYVDIDQDYGLLEASRTLILMFPSVFSDPRMPFWLIAANRHIPRAHFFVSPPR